MGDNQSSQWDYAAYVEQTAQLLGIEIPEAYQQGVVENMAQLSAIAQQVMEFPLPPNTEIAPVFKP
ncbi:DUF4089 domain-containing protein [Euhalothece natronophila Z-M001]|uniref:DUF4089 domain-containing protein n=2 Tax=Euhalothece TaxID=65097 RepID=A0A5B8NTT7_9CHRO|nr:DUF4089 domain-containing protein [Euhalothece natronophila Z-M001]